MVGAVLFLTVGLQPEMETSFGSLSTRVGDVQVGNELSSFLCPWGSTQGWA